jgi:hypothetical protein
MYCPSCGSNNQAEVKFCTRCGKSLAFVSEALSGKAASPSALDERMVKLFKDYYRSRHSMILGSIASIIALFKLILFALVPFPALPGFLGILTTLLLIYGVISLLWGIGTWSESASEIKAIERAAALGTTVRPVEARPVLTATESASVAAAPATDPLAYPGSVTEQTTRQLEERVYKPPTENRTTSTQ